MDFTFTELNLTVTLRPTTNKISKEISAEFQKFVGPLSKNNGIAEATDSKAANFIATQVHKLLKDFYKLEVGAFEYFDESVTLPEVYGFMLKQIEVNGPHDFLLQPIGALLKGFETVIKELNSKIETEAKKLMEPITSDG